MTQIGNKAPGGGSDQSEGGTKLRRVDTGEWEEAQEGVVYYSPDQCGGFFGTVHRMFYSGSNARSDLHTVTISAGGTFITGGGYVSTSGGSAQYGFPYHDAFAADVAEWLTGAFNIGTSWAGSYKIYVDFVPAA